MQQILYSLLILIFLTGCDSVTMSEHTVGREVMGGNVATLSHESTTRAMTIIFKPGMKNAGNVINKISTDLISSENLIVTALATVEGNIQLIDAIHDERTRLISLAHELSEGDRVLVLAENPPDTAKENGVGIELKLPEEALTDLNFDYTEKLVRLASLKSTNYLLRDVLYRTNEALLNKPSLLSEDAYVEIVGKTLDAITKINELSPVDAPLEIGGNIIGVTTGGNVQQNSSGANGGNSPH